MESPERVAARIVEVARRPRAEVVAQPLRRKLLFALNLVAPGLVDRLLAWVISQSAAEPG